MDTNCIQTLLVMRSSDIVRTNAEGGNLVLFTRNDEDRTFSAMNVVEVDRVDLIDHAVTEIIDSRQVI